MVAKMKCSLCDKQDFDVLLKFNKAPQNIQRLLRKEELLKDKLISFKLVKCKYCDMVQLDNPNLDPESYYDDYFMTTSFLEQLKNYESDLCDLFVSDFQLKGKTLLEIGCGEGQFLTLFRNKGVDVIGVEPSELFYKIAVNKRLKVINEYFNDKTSLKENSCDAFVSRQVFEHVKNPNEILRTAHRVLNEGGVGMIEVPSFEKTIVDRRYYDIFPDHVCYYTKNTLLFLLNKNGFEVTKIFNSFNDEYLVVFFRKNQNVFLDDFVNNFEIYKLDTMRKLEELSSDGKKIVIWGAGGKGNAFLNLCDIKHSPIKYIIDSDKAKQGKYTIGTHYHIKNPDILLSDKDVDIVIISAMAYHKEIKKTLKEKYKFAGDIYTISPKLKKIADD